jgi:hypothetical protein
LVLNRLRAQPPSIGGRDGRAVLHQNALGRARKFVETCLRVVVGRIKELLMRDRQKHVEAAAGGAEE